MCKKMAETGENGIWEIEKNTELYVKFAFCKKVCYT